MINYTRISILKEFTLILKEDIIKTALLFKGIEYELFSSSRLRET